MSLHNTPRRGGFTLIELLTVIALLAVLSAVSIGGFFRIRAGQEIRSTEATLSKVNTALNRLWSATRDAADKEFKTDANSCATLLVPYCGGDRDRARSLYLYLKLKADFPQTFAEAGAATVLRDASNVTIYTIPAKKLYTSEPLISPLSSLDANQQAAVLLYRIITERGTGGETYGDEATGATGGDVAPGVSLRVFRDVWATPIGYVRWATNGEIDGPPFTKAGVASQDPLDPAGKLKTPWSNRDAAIQSVFGAGMDSTRVWVQDTNNPKRWTTNWLPTVYSAGPNVKYDFTPVADTNGLFKVPADTDNILGYRLKREGQTGN